MPTKGDLYFRMATFRNPNLYHRCIIPTSDCPICPFLVTTILHNLHEFFAAKEFLLIRYLTLLEDIFLLSLFETDKLTDVDYPIFLRIKLRH